MILLRSPLNYTNSRLSFQRSQSKDKHSRIEKTIGIFFFFIVLLANLSTPISVAGRVITASELLIVIVIIMLIPKLCFRFNHLLIYLIIFSVAILSLVTSINKQESIKSLLSFALYSLFTFILIEISFSKPLLRNRILDSFLLAVLFLASFAIVQFVLVQILGPLPRIVYPFGEYTWHIQRQLLFIWRANSLYYEPNIFGMVAAFGLFLGIRLDKNCVWLFVVAIGIVVSFATTTYFLVITALIAQLLLSGSLKGRAKSSRAVTSVFLIVILILILFASNYEILAPLEGVPVLSRINEIVSPGTSGFYRVSMPLKISLITIENYPLGVGIGAIDKYLADPPNEIFYYLQKGSSGYGTTVDNILLGWIITNGLAGLIYFVFFGILVWMMLFRESVSLGIALLFFSLGTGAFLGIEFWTLLLICMVILTDSSDSLAFHKDGDNYQSAAL